MRLGQPDQHPIRGDDPLAGERLLRTAAASARSAGSASFAMSASISACVATPLISSKMPLVWSRSWRTVTGGSGRRTPGRRFPTTSSRRDLAARDGVEDQGRDDRLRDAGDAEPGRPGDRGPAGVRVPGREEGALVAMADDRECARRTVCLASRIQEGLRGGGRDGGRQGRRLRCGRCGRVDSAPGRTRWGPWPARTRTGRAPPHPAIARTASPTVAASPTSSSPRETGRQRR